MTPFETKENTFGILFLARFQRFIKGFESLGQFQVFSPANLVGLGIDVVRKGHPHFPLKYGEQAGGDEETVWAQISPL